MDTAHEWEFLPFLERFVRVLEQEFEGEPCGSPFYFPEDPDEQVPLILMLSLNQFTRLLSAVTKGSTLTYPLESDSVNWLLLQAVECHMDLCTIIQDCIGAQLAAMEAGITAANAGIAGLQEFALRGEGGQKTTFAPPSTQASCDEGRVGGGVLAVIEFMVTTIIDLMQIAEASEAGDDLEEWRDLIAAIPVFETLPIDDAFQFVDAMYQNQQEDFEAAVTETWKMEAGQLLYCDVIANNCTLDTETLKTWFMGLRAAFPSNLAADIFTRFGEATTPSLANQANQFLNQVLNGRSNEDIFQFYGRIIRAYTIGTQTEVFGWEACDDCITQREGAYPVPDAWTVATNAGTYQGDWLILHAPHTIEINILQTKEISAVRFFWWTQTNPTEGWTCGVDNGTPEAVTRTWSGWGIPNIAECIFASPITGDVIKLSLPGAAYVVVQWVEWDACTI